jgi:hypothetical protein
VPQLKFFWASFVLHAFLLIALYVVGRAALYPLIHVKSAFPEGASIIFDSSVKGIKIPKGKIAMGKSSGRPAPKRAKKPMAKKTAKKEVVIAPQKAAPKKVAPKKLEIKKEAPPKNVPLVKEIAPVEPEISVVVPSDVENLYVEVQEGEPIRMSRETYDALGVQGAIARAVRAHWNIPRGVSPDCVCDVKVTIASDGVKREVVVIKSSRVVLYDIAARAAAFRAAYPKEAWGSSQIIRF